MHLLEAIDQVNSFRLALVVQEADRGYVVWLACQNCRRCPFQCQIEVQPCAKPCEVEV